MAVERIHCCNTMKRLKTNAFAALFTALSGNCLHYKSHIYLLISHTHRLTSQLCAVMSPTWYPKPSIDEIFLGSSTLQLSNLPNDNIYLSTWTWHRMNQLQNSSSNRLQIKCDFVYNLSVVIQHVLRINIVKQLKGNVQISLNITQIISNNNNNILYYYY